MESIETYRKFLKAAFGEEWDGLETDQVKKLPHPLVQKPYPENAKLIDLIAVEDFTIGKMPLIDVVNRRRSRRRFIEKPLDLEELSFLLWATQGVRKIFRDGLVTFRTVPSGGGRHSFEGYLFINRVVGLEPGLYRYLPLEHKLCFLYTEANLAEKISDACCSQSFVKNGAVIFIWTTIPYRMEWRYSIIAHKIIAIDAGHLCQNLYLASEAIEAGTCAIAAYNQNEMDTILGVDGEEEFVVYVAPVGKIK